MGVTRVDQLSDSEKARCDEWADKWIEIGLRTGPADRERFEASVADCYRFAELPPPDVVVWVPSPMVLALAAPTAAYAIEMIEAERGGALRHGAVGGAVDAAVHEAVDGAVHEAVHGAVQGAVHGAVQGAVVGAVHEAVDGAVQGAVGGAVHGAVGGAVVVAVHGAVGEAVDRAVDGAVDRAVDGAVDRAVRGAVNEAVVGAVVGAVGGAVREAVREAVGEAVDGAVDGAVHEAVDGAVHQAVDGAVVGAVDGAVDRAVHQAVDGAVVGAVGGAVQGAVVGAVDEAVRNNWYRVIGGQFWVGGWYYGGSWTSFFREVCDLDLPGDLWDRARAYEGTMESACWWWPHRRFVMVCERPVAIHRELANPDVERGWGSHRLHREDGPAVVWPDGWGVWSWHGVRVPQHVIEHPESITSAQILAEENAEVRRVMIERMTPERFLAESEARPVQQDDYGKLWRIELADDEPLVMVELENSTIEPDGSRKTYFLRVSPECVTARAAAAWTFGMSESEYVLAAQS